MANSRPRKDDKKSCKPSQAELKRKEPKITPVSGKSNDSKVGKAIGVGSGGVAMQKAQEAEMVTAGKSGTNGDKKAFHTDKATAVKKGKGMSDHQAVCPSAEQGSPLPL